MAGDLLIRVKFSGEDKLSRLLDRMQGSTTRAGQAIAKANRQIREQKRELGGVQRELARSSGNVTHLIDRERALERSIAGANRQLERQKKIAGINATVGRAGAIGKDMVASGQSTLFSTAMLAAPLFAAAKAGAEFESFRNRMKVLGLGDRAVDDLTAFARAMDVAGSSVNENMRYLLEAQGVFRESGEHDLAHQLAGAKLMAPMLARMHVAMAAMGKELSEEQERYFLRFVEQSGGLVSPKRAAEMTDGLFRALQSSGGNVQAQDYSQFLARAGIAGSHLSNRAMFADFEPLIAEMHEQAGVGLATGFKMASGIKVNSRAANEYLRLGIWDKSKVTLNSLGNVKSTKGNPLESRAAHLLQTDPVEFYRSIVMPAYARGGIKTSEARAYENAKLFGGTGGNLFNLIDKQLPTLLKSRSAYGKTQNLNTAYNQTNESFFGQQGKLRAAAKDFMVAAGTKGGLLDNIVSLMQRATAALRAFTAFGDAHPTAFSWLGAIVVNLLALRAGVGIAKIAFGGLLGPLAQLWGVWSRFRLAGSFVEAFRVVARAAGLLRTAFLLLGQGVMRAGLMMLANPIVLAVVAIGAAIGLGAYLVYRNWDKIKAAFTAAWNWLKGLVPVFKNIGSMLLDGLMSMLDPGRLAKHLWNLGKSAVSAFKNVLGIHSPSRVFAEMGGHMMGGLAVGLDRGVRHPIKRLRAAGAGLAGAAAVSFTPGTALAAGGAGAQQNHYSITIHARDGESADALADRIMRRIEQKHGRDARSSYRDND